MTDKYVAPCLTRHSSLTEAENAGWGGPPPAQAGAADKPKPTIRIRGSSSDLTNGHPQLAVVLGR